MSHENEIDITPNFGEIRKQFSREARLKADTILASLLPEELIPAEYIKQTQLGVLREFQSVLNSIDLVVQCTSNNQQLSELRDLVHEVSQTIIAKANAIEAALAEPLFRVFNATDGLYASEEAMSMPEAIRFINRFRERFVAQGYYKTAEGERIPPELIELRFQPVVPITPPHAEFMTSDGFRLHWSAEHQVWFTGENWDDRDMEFDASGDGWPIDSWGGSLEGDYIEEGK